MYPKKTDESLTLWKGSLSCKWHLPLKSSQFGIKMFGLYESSSAYMWSFTVYTGKETILESPLISKKHIENKSSTSETF
jgi:hypothetical protein